MKVTKLTRLKSEITIPNVDIDPDRIFTNALFEAAPGCFLHLALGSAGVQIFHGQSRVLVTVEALVALAQQVDPTLRPEAIAVADATTRAEREQAAQQFRARLEAKATAKQSGTSSA